MKRAWLVPVVGIAIVMGGCSSSSKPTSAATSSTARPAATGETRTVKVDNSTPDFVAGFLAYFPDHVTVHPGDTVNFSSIFSGEPHSVTLGTLVDKGLASIKGLDPNSNAPPPPDFASLPVMLPHGPGDADQRAVNPCFVASGPLPADPTAKCPVATIPEFNGKQAYVNSGFLDKGANFALKLAKDIAPGSYTFYCALHTHMTGTLAVAPPATAIPSEAEVDAAGVAQLKAITDQLAPAAQGASAGHPPVPPGVSLPLAGLGTQNVQNAIINQFFPATINTTVGKKVAWTIFGPHTITFGAGTPPPYVIMKGPDGAYHLDPQADGPVPPPSGPPPAPNASGPTTVDGGTYSGTGLHNSGTQVSFPPDLTTYTLTFTKAGTYSYVCLIHPGMIGQVVVQ